MNGGALPNLGLDSFVWPQVYLSVALVVYVWLDGHAVSCHYCCVFPISVIRSCFEIQKSLSGVHFGVSVCGYSFCGGGLEFDLAVTNPSSVFASAVRLLKNADI